MKIRPRGIRFKLMIWYATAFSVAGSLIFLSFYFLTKQALYFQTDTTLSVHGMKVMEVALRQSEGMHDELSRQAFLSEFSKIPGMLIAIGDAKGKIISSSLSGKENDEAIGALMKSGGGDEGPVYRNKQLGSTLIRFWISPIEKDAKLVGMIAVGHPIDVIENSLSSLLSAMVVVYISLVILTMLGGYLLAERAIQPINEITEKIMRINSENLAEKVRVPKTGDEIEELARTFNEGFDRLDLAFKRERQFIGDLAHELKTPLATLRGEIELALSKKRKPEEYRKAFAEALGDATRLSGTLTNLLDLAWTRTDAKMEKVNLSEMMKELSEVARKLSPARRIKIDSEIAKKIFVLGRRDKLSRAVLNLVDNAIKFAPNGGKVGLFLGKEEDWAVIRITDNGKGIGKNDRPYIFERFYRGKNTKTAGSGLGLPIALAIIEAHRGKLVIKSKRVEGTTASVYLKLLK